MKVRDFREVSKSSNASCHLDLVEATLRDSGRSMAI